MSTPIYDGEDHGDVFLDEEDIVEEISVDEEDLPDADDDAGSAAEAFDEADDSIHIFKGHTDELYTVACSPTDATLVATGGRDDKGFLWRLGQGDWEFELQGHKDSVSCVSFSSDGQLVASGSFDGVIQVWDILSGNLKCTLDGPGGGIEGRLTREKIQWVRWHPRGHLVLAGSEDSSVWMWNADMGEYLNTFSGHASNVTCGDFTPDGKIICTGSDDKSLRVWNPKTGEHIHVVQEKWLFSEGHFYHTEGLTCLTITADSSLVLTGSEDGSVHVVNISTGRVVTSLLSHTDSIECIGLSSSFPWAATGSLDNKLIIWDLQHSIPRCTCEHEERVTCLSWIGGSRFVATGCVDGRVRIWDSLSGECVKTLRGHKSHNDIVESIAVSAIAVSADGNHLVSVSLDRTARVFEIDEFH